MDAWLTRLLGSKPAAHGEVSWWQGENAADTFCGFLKGKNIRQALAYGQGSEPMQAVADAVIASGVEWEWVQSGSPKHRGEKTVILTDVPGLPAAARLAENLRRQARKAEHKLQPIRRANAEVLPAEEEPSAAASPAETIPAESGEERMDAAPAGAPEESAQTLTEAKDEPETEAKPDPGVGTSKRVRYALTIEDALAFEGVQDVPAGISSAEKGAETASPQNSREPEPALLVQPAAEETAEGYALLVLVPDTLALPPFAAMTAPPDGVLFLPNFARETAADALADVRLSALVAAAETLICRKTAAQTRQDAQSALTLINRKPLTAELCARMLLTAGSPEGYAACLGEAVHAAHSSVPLGAARLACLRELTRRYGMDARHGLHLASLSVGCGDKKCTPEVNAAAFTRWLDTLCEEGRVAQAWRCLRNTELPELVETVLPRVRLAAPRHLGQAELTQVLAALKLPDGQEAIQTLCRRQQTYFETGSTLSLEFRFRRLTAVKRWLDTHEEAIQEALFADLGKSAFEAYETEIMLVREELHYLRTHLSALAATAWYRAPLIHWPSRCFTVQEPYGRVLIMAPWNYPFLLSMNPLLGAIAAGNCAVLKPSAYAPATSRLLAEMTAELFDPEYVAVVEGGREENRSLLEQKFDTIFFTGSVTVGKVVMTAAAQNLTPVTLELGGKSPCIVDETADLSLAAKRIVWGKFLNAGQTCVAPDYVLCHESVREKLVKEMRVQVKKAWGASPLDNPDLPRIVNRHHFERLCGYLTQGTVEIGGHTREETLQIEPTLLTGLSAEDSVMQEEIFGPILPVVPYGDFPAMLAALRERPKPLAAYLFTRSQQHEELFLHRLPFGGGCVNDVVCHLAVTCMPFGGVGESGMGSYHGKKSFETFSHTKSVLKKSLRVDVPVRYAPYTNKRKWLKRFSK